MGQYIILITLLSLGTEPAPQTVALPTSQVVWEYSDAAIAAHQVNRFELRIDSDTWQSVGLPLTASGEYRAAIPPTLPGDHVLSVRACSGELCGFSASVAFSLEETAPPANPLYAVSVAPTAAPPGSQIAVSWSATGTRTEHDWVAIYGAGADSGDYTEGLWAHTHGTAEGSVTFTAPAAGAYDVRYLLNDGYTAVASASLMVVVTPPPPTAPPPTAPPPTAPPPAADFAVSVAPMAAQPGSQIVVSWTAAGKRSERDWVGVYPAGADTGNYTEGLWAYTHGTTTGSVTFTAPAAGAYDVRYLLNDGYEAAASASFDVVTALPPALVHPNPHITQLLDIRVTQSPRW